MKYYKNKYLLIIITALLLLSSFSISASTSGEFKRILKYYKTRNIRFKRHALSFIKKHPGSYYAPSIYLMLSYNTSNLNSSINYLKKIIIMYPNYKNREAVYSSLLNLYYLGGSWKSLTKWAKKGLSEDETSALYKKYLLYGQIKSGTWSNAQKTSLQLIKSSKKKNRGQLYLQRSLILENMTGLSKKYLKTLATLLENFKNMDEYPALLLMLGDFYLEHHSYNKAYSAYKDLSQRYPRSTESLDALKKIKRIAIKKPRYTTYIPDKKLFNKLDDIDISHDRITQNNVGSTYFSISVGPLYTKKQYNGLKKILKEYGDIRIVSIKKSIYLYIGKLASTKSAMSLKVRLAEEQGINGHIVRVYGKKVKYIYEE